jgi:glycerophosphoryl diester phosphodiesterase
MKRLLAVALALSGCSTEEGRPVDDAGAEVAVPAIDAARFDCRATTPPARRSPVSYDCVTDRGCEQRMISAHRGAGAPGELAPENTLSAFRAAIVAGADVTETDVRLTADGVLVLIHDGNVMRTLEGSGDVSSLTLEQLRAMPVKATRYQGQFGCERVPTLEETLALTKGRIHLILDASKIPQIEVIVAAVQKYNAVNDVIFDTDGNVEKLKAALALEPKLNFSVRATSPDLVDVAIAAPGAQPLYVHIEDAPPNTMAPKIRAHGLRVFALGFLADGPAESADFSAYEALYTGGATFIQTNRPELLARALGR